MPNHLPDHPDHRSRGPAPARPDAPLATAPAAQRRVSDQPPARVLRADELTALLTSPPDRLDLDVAQPGVRAVLTLLARVKAIEAAEGSWNGGDVVDALSTWLDELGIDPEAPITDLTGRVVTTAPAAPTDDRKAIR